MPPPAPNHNPGRLGRNRLSTPQTVQDTMAFHHQQRDTPKAERRAD